jgi:NAD-dependent DNA ligase
MERLAAILIIAALVVGVFIGNALVPPLIQPAGNCTITEPKVCPKCNVTDTSSIQRAFQRCFNDFNPSGQAKTCINYMRFKDCINTNMGRFK